MADKKNAGGMLLAFLAGSVVGVALGLLFAPSSGAETRRKIKATSLDAKDKALEKVEEVKSEAAQLVERGRSEAAQLVERGRERVTGIKSQVQAAVEAGKEAYTQKKSEMMPEPKESKKEE